MREVHTPPRDQTSANRPTKSKCSSILIRDLRKVTYKSQNPAFKAALEGDSTAVECLKEFSEVSVTSQFGESAENFTAAYPVDTHSPKTAAISDLTSISPSSEISYDKHVSTNLRDIKLGYPQIDSDHKIESYEAQVVIKYLREARIQVLKSKDLASSKKFLDAVIHIVVEELYGSRCEETEWLDELTSSKLNVVPLIFMLGIFALLVFWFCSSGTKGFVIRPSPT